MNDDGNEFFRSHRYKPATPVGEPHTSLIWYGDRPATPPNYLVDETLPEIGVATVGGQYGAAKTFVAADLAAAIIIGGGDFAGKPTRRKGGVLWLAAEGEMEIEMRVHAAIAARGGAAEERHPFARQAGAVPCLGQGDAFERLNALAAQAVEHLRTDFQCELALIVIDTLAAAAGFDDENSAAETQKVMNVLAALSRETKTLVIVIDHYGKVIDTGVRGSSAKSAAADAILACLGDRDQTTGATSNRRLAVTKLRAGPVGRVVPFDLMPTGDGSTCAVRWRTDAETEPPKGKKWPKALIIFKRALDEALGSAGKKTTPRAGMPEVRAVDREAVRDEFFSPLSGGHREGEARRLPSLRKGRRRAGRHVLDQRRPRPRADHLLDAMSAANRAGANHDLDAANRLNPMGCEAFCVASDRLMRRFATFCVVLRRCSTAPHRAPGRNDRNGLEAVMREGYDCATRRGVGQGPSTSRAAGATEVFRDYKKR